MKGLIRNTVFNGLSLYILSMILPGVKMKGGISTILISGLVLSLLFSIIKPILNILSLPLNVVTLGLFSFFINAILLYILTIFVPQVHVTQFTFNGYQVAGFIIPVMHFNSLFALIISAAFLSIIMNFFDWITDKH